MSGFTLPQLGSNEARNFGYALSSYCVSPSVSTPARPVFTSRSEVAISAQLLEVPWPPWKFGLAGSHAMSPAAAITGSPPPLGGGGGGGGLGIAGGGGGGEGGFGLVGGGGGGGG